MIEILTDKLHKIAYSTDASVYREVPYGVAYPKDEADLHELVETAQRLKVSIIPRAAGTSIAGQVVGSGLVADVSRYLNRIIEINAAERYAIVEPGVIRDELNIALKPYGLFFSPETSTSNRCCLGGMFGNNSCGTHSLVYGSTRQHILEADAVLADNTSEHFAQYSVAELEERFGQNFWTKPHHDLLIEKIYSQLICWALDPETRLLIADSYPDRTLARRSCGYAIDETIEDLCDQSKPFRERTMNLCRLLAGSEGTLALIYRIKVSLDPLPEKYIMALCAHCVTLNSSFTANLIALKHFPTAVELMDGELLKLSKSHLDVERFFVEGDPAALLIVEMRSSSEKDLNIRADALQKRLLDSGLVTCCTRVYGSDVEKVWRLRKAGLGVLGGMKGDARPTGVIEDTAVAPARLPDYMADFQKMLGRLGVSCIYYGHISTGELHLRPILNLKTPQGKELFHRIACETTQLVRRHRGTISGEHGDGRLRGEFIPMLYGEQAYELMRRLKYCWDESALLNPRKIVDTPRMDESLRADAMPLSAVEALPDGLTERLPLVGNWKADFDECTTRGATGAASQQQALICTVEQCNGSGDCRKTNLTGGTMCPAYKVSGDELMTTRARTNVLREYLSSIVADAEQVDAADVKQMLDSCLACKGCRRECPSGVDMTALRAEMLQLIYDKQGMPLRARMVAHNADFEHLGSLMPNVYNFFASNALTSKLIKKFVGFAPERQIPQVSRARFVTRKSSADRRTVLFYADEFTTYQDHQVGQTFIYLLEALGYNVVIPRHAESGRAAMSKGELRQAKRCAEKNVALLSKVVTAETPLVGIEPSCILSFRDEYVRLVSPEHRDKARRLAANSLLFDEFLMREVQAGRLSSDMFSDLKCEVWLHGHCHQKALVGVEKTASLLRLPKGVDLHVIPSGCCGMAGSFGYEKEHYSTSLAIGEMILFPAVRRAVENNSLEHPVFVAAPGTSCRTQIYDGTGVMAHHPVEILFLLLKR